MRKFILSLFDGISHTQLEKAKIDSFIKIANVALIIAATIISIDIILSFKLIQIFAKWVIDAPKPEIQSLLDLSSEKLGPFGDFFGGVLNPIFSFFTFIGLIITIVLQRVQNSEDKINFEKTNNESHYKASEDTVFKIIDLHNKIVEDISIDESDIKIPLSSSETQQLRNSGQLVTTGQYICEFHKTSLITAANRKSFGACIKIISRYKECDPEEILKTYVIIQNDNNYIFGHYFRNLYQAIKVIDQIPETSANYSKRKTLTNLIRSQLSADELCILFINCLDRVVDDGAFRDLLIKYEFLEHIPLVRDAGFYKIKGRDIAIANERMITQYIKTSADGTKMSAFGKNKAFV